jgi:hypothetical protein
MATSGVLIASDNNTICRNTISNCQYTVKLQGDNNTIYANNLFFTEARNDPENAFAIDTGHNNYWNSTIPISYRHNNTTFVNYIGNYWDGRICADLDDDGIWDVPYSINDDASDCHPLRKPYAEEYALNARSISLPNLHRTEQHDHCGSQSGFAEDNRHYGKSHDQQRVDRIKRDQTDQNIAEYLQIQLESR